MYLISDLPIINAGDCYGRRHFVHFSEDSFATKNKVDHHKVEPCLFQQFGLKQGSATPQMLAQVSFGRK